MSRYIDADALLNDLQPLFVHNGNLKDEWMSYCVEKIIIEQPTADVVEVVRCKDCIHNHEHETPFGSKFHICNINNLAFTQYADFYCAYGERRKDGEVL